MLCLNRKTVFGPSYGSPVKKMAILPASNPNSRYMAYITQDKVKKCFSPHKQTMHLIITTV